MVAHHLDVLSILKEIFRYKNDDRVEKSQRYLPANFLKWAKVLGFGGAPKSVDLKTKGAAVHDGMSFDKEVLNLINIL